MLRTEICVEDLSTGYQLGVIGTRTLSGTVKPWWARQRGKPDPFLKVGEVDHRNRAGETIWALRDVSFSVQQGEAVGIIGRNGAGKSTLLKILSQVTAPTSGIVKVKGRIASLLEVGTGFHPELTGRENIYLNGAIMGMSRAEITSKFDEIVDFSGVEKFIDTPVKRYSSGMYVRLAFAVAAHLEPEILVVDEVLAVGDAEFQKKCLGKMGDVAHEGRTVLFVSHNMNAIASLCNRCILLDKGAVGLDGETPAVTSFYQSSIYSLAENVTDLSDVQRYGTGRARFESVRVLPVGRNNAALPYLVTGNDLKIELNIIAYSNIRDANVAIIIYDALGFRLIDANTALQNAFLSLAEGQAACVEFRLHNLLLKPGNYLLGLWIGQATYSEDIDGITHVTSFTVEPDLEAIRNPTVFPGPYQCKFSHSIHPLKEEINPSRG